MVSLFASTLALLPALLVAAEPKVPVEIKLSPRVGRIQDVEGTVNATGTPVIFVKSTKPQEPWWVQNSPVPLAPKQFKVRLIFGNDKSPSGSQFHVVAMMLPKTAKLQDFQPGAQYAHLPEFPQSNRLIVTLLNGNQAPGVEVVPAKSPGQQPSNNKTAATEPVVAPEIIGNDDIAAITTPIADTEVRRVTEVIGRVAVGRTPIVLVRPMTKENLWWIQNRPQVTDDGTFKTKVVLGSEQTPEGTRFRIIVLVCEQAADAANFKVGASLKQLPEAMKTSSEVTVTYRPTKASGQEPQKTPPTAEPTTAEVRSENEKS